MISAAAALPPAYRSIPRDRPVTLEELAVLYRPMAEHWAFRIHAAQGGNREPQRSLDDLVQDAWVGILEAWWTWEPERGAIFRTYANSRARWAVLNGNRNVDMGLYRAYVHDRELYGRIVAMWSLDRPASTNKFQSVGKGEDDSMFSLVDILPDPEALGEYCLLDADDAFLSLLRMVRNVRIRMALALRYGRGLSLGEVGAALDPRVGGERVRQLIKEGLGEIRKGLEGIPGAGL